MIFSPFSFRSEERAAKRKEARLGPFVFTNSKSCWIKMLKLALFFCCHFPLQFFQKLEERKIAEEAENKHLQTRSQVAVLLNMVNGKSLILRLIMTQKVAISLMCSFTKRKHNKM